MRWLVALGVILLAFGVFVFVEVRGSTSADANSKDSGEPPQATNPTEAPSPTTRPTNQPGIEAKRPTLAGVVENIRAKAGATSSGAAPSLASGETARSAGSGSTERPADADDYLPDANGSPPSALRVKLRGAARRMNNGNYKGAFEVANEMIEAYPTDPEPFTLAVPSLCAMGDTDRAATYLGRVTDEDSRKQIVEGCAGFGVKLP